MRGIVRRWHPVGAVDSTADRTVEVKRKETYQEGASDERTVWMAKLRLLRKQGVGVSVLDCLIDWGKGRVKRYNAKRGSLGH